MDQLRCTVVDHEEYIIGICVAKSCPVGNRLMCVECLSTIHSQCNNQVYSKKEFISRLEYQKQDVDRNQPHEIQELREVVQSLIDTIKPLQKTINNILESSFNARKNRIRRINEIIENRQLLKPNHWRDGYELLCSQEELIPPDTNQIKTELQRIKQSLDAVTSHKFQQIKRVSQPVQQNWNAVTIKQPLVIKTPHRILTIALSPNGKHIATAGEGDNDRFISIWDPNIGKQVGNNLIGHESTIRTIMYSSSGNLIVSCGEDQTIRQWDVQNQIQIGNAMIGHADYIYVVQYTPDEKHIVSCSKDQTVRIWDSQTCQEQLDKRIRHTDNIFCICLSSNSNEVVFGDSLGKIQIWNYDNSLQIGQTIQGHTNAIMSIRYSPDNKMIVSCGNDLAIRIWDAITRIQIGKQLIGHTSIYLMSVNFSPNMKYVISGGSDQTMRIWNRVTGQEIGDSIMHSGIISAAQFSLDGKYIISGNYQQRELRVMISPV